MLTSNVFVATPYGELVNAETISKVCVEKRNTIFVVVAYSSETEPIDLARYDEEAEAKTQLIEWGKMLGKVLFTLD